MKTFIEVNKHPAGRVSNILFGLASFLDGIVRVISFGFLHTRLPLEISKWQVRRHSKKLKG